MTEQDVITLVASALSLAPEKVAADSIAGDFPEWDSMGMLMIVTLLDREGVRFDPGDTAALQSVQGVLAACRSAGRLQ